MSSIEKSYSRLRSILRQHAGFPETDGSAASYYASKLRVEFKGLYLEDALSLLEHCITGLHETETSPQTQASP